MKLGKILFFGFFIFVSFSGFSQFEDSLGMPLYLDTEENVAFDQCEEEEFQKVNLNAADLSPLLTLPFVSFLDIQSILNYRKLNGSFRHPLELFQVSGISEVTKNLLYNKIEVKSPEWKSVDLSERKHVLSVRWKRMFRDDASSYSPWSQLYRYMGSYSHHWNWGMMIAKDPEEQWKNVEYLFKSGFIQWSSVSGKWKVIVGDYAARWGQGLTMQGGFLSRPGFQLASLIQGGSDIRPYTSTIENLKKRGVVLKYKTEFHSLLIGGSQRWWHGSVDTLGIMHESSNTIFSDSSAMSHWRKGKDWSCFVFDNWRVGSHRLGIGMLQTYQNSSESNIHLSSNRFYCLDWNLQKDNRHLFLESKIWNQQIQWIQGGMIQMHPQFSLGWRTEGNIEAKNRTFLVMNHRVQTEWQWNQRGSSYFGVSQSKVMNPTIDLCSWQQQAFVQVNWTPRRYHHWYYRGQWVNGQEWSALEILLKRRDYKRWIHRWDGQWKINDVCGFHYRVEYCLDTRFEDQSGYGFFEFDFHPMEQPFQLVFRYLYFHCQEWEMRRYVQERSVTGSYYLPVLYGTGSRFYFFVKCNFKRVNFQLKWGDFNFDQRDVFHRWSMNQRSEKRTTVDVRISYEW